MLERDIEIIYKDIQKSAPKTLVEIPSLIFHTAMDYSDTPIVYKNRLMSHITYVANHPNTLFSNVAANALRGALDEATFKAKYVDESEHISGLASDQNLAVAMQYICIVLNMELAPPSIMSKLLSEILETYVQRTRRKMVDPSVSGFVGYIQSRLSKGIVINTTYALSQRLSLS